MSEQPAVEVVAMEVILAAGNARSMAYAALRAAKQGDFKAAEAHMACSRRELAKAHDVQTQLIQQEAAGHPAPLNLLMIHAQDHLMTAIAEQQLIQELIELHQKLGGFSQGE